MTYQFSEKNTTALPHLIVHRVNLVDRLTAVKNLDLQTLVGSKSEIFLIDSETKNILIPPSAGAEVDCWIFGNEKIILTHNNPHLNRINEYPRLESYLEAWQIKREAEKKLGLGHGIILANLKTHGNEEVFLKKFKQFGIPLTEVILLDEEPLATDRLLRTNSNSLARRVSRVESFENIFLTLKQDELAVPRALFYDPNGCWASETPWPFDHVKVSEMYVNAPHMLSIICCPSRWEHPEQIEPLAKRLLQSNLKLHYIMTDIKFMKKWEPFLTYFLW